MKKNNNKLILVGGGGHCKSCIDVIESTGEYQIKGILDLPEKLGQKVLSYPIIGTDDDIKRLAAEGYRFAITVGQIKTSRTREKIYRMINEAGGVLPVIVSSRAQIARSSELAEGTVVMHSATINSDARVGKACIINTGAIIEHDCVIGEFTHISTSVVINGGVDVGSRCFIGSNSVSHEYIIIKDDSLISANSIIR
jgi:sugar O-acyltransferase (sialic acid O-acetyltransferase NeuD family)